jgi:hypothetical protein
LLAAFKTRPVSTNKKTVSVPISPGLPASAQSVGYSSNWELLNFEDAETACQKQCAHLVTYSSLAEQVGATAGSWMAPAITPGFQQTDR